MAKRGVVFDSKWGVALARFMAANPHCKTQSKLARRSGVAQATIGRILRGEVNPQSDTMARLAQGLRVPLRTLMDATEDDNVGQPSAFDDAVLQLLTHWEDRMRAEEVLVALRGKEDDAIRRLEERVLPVPHHTVGGDSAPLSTRDGGSNEKITVQ